MVNLTLSEITQIHNNYIIDYNNSLQLKINMYIMLYYSNFCLILETDYVSTASFFVFYSTRTACPVVLVLLCSLINSLFCVISKIM